MRNTELAIFLASVIAAAAVAAGFFIYSGDTATGPTTNSIPPGPPLSNATFTAGEVSVSFADTCLAYTQSGTCAQSANFTLSTTIANVGQNQLVLVNGYVDGTAVGSCVLNVLPNHAFPCSISGTVACSELSGGYPYSVKLEGTFLDGESYVVETTATTSQSPC